MWRIILNLKGIAWTMPGKIIAGREDVHMLKIRVDGELSQLVFGGQLGRRGVPDVLRERP